MCDKSVSCHASSDKSIASSDKYWKAVQNGIQSYQPERKYSARWPSMWSMGGDKTYERTIPGTWKHGNGLLNYFGIGDRSLYREGTGLTCDRKISNKETNLHLMFQKIDAICLESNHLYSPSTLYSAASMNVTIIQLDDWHPGQARFSRLFQVCLWPVKGARSLCFETGARMWQGSVSDRWVGGCPPCRGWHRVVGRAQEVRWRCQKGTQL